MTNLEIRKNENVKKSNYLTPHNLTSIAAYHDDDFVHCKRSTIHKSKYL